MVRILIADKDSFFRHVVAKYIGQEATIEALTIDEVASGEQVLEWTKDPSSLTNILLINHRLEGDMDGITTLEAILPRNPTIDAVLFTGFDEDGIFRRVNNLGVRFCLVKPFPFAQLIWIIRSLIQQRSANFEIAWLHTLSAVAERVQRAGSIQEVGKALVRGGIELGFKRAWLYRFDKTNPARSLIQGVAQIGIEQLANFDTRQWPLADARYAQEVVNSLDIRFFRGSELGPGLPLNGKGTELFPLPTKEWIGIPLQSEQDRQCLGLMYLDVGDGAARLNHEQHNLLHLFMRQAASAFERTLLLEEEELRKKALSIIDRIRERQTDTSESYRLHTLLTALYTEIKSEVPFENFIVVLGDKAHRWLHYILHFENGVPQTTLWRDYRESGLIAHLVGIGQSLYLPHGVKEYREQFNLPQVGQKAARSWMGALLSPSQELSGAMIFEHDSQMNAFTPSHFYLVQSLARELSSLIQIIWQKERVEELSRPLQALQRASYDLMVLVEDRDGTGDGSTNKIKLAGLWTAICALATAPYGFAFDRAMLYLVEEGGTCLRGVEGIGYCNKEDTEQHFTAQVLHGGNFANCIANIWGEAMPVTPVGEAVRRMVLEIGAGDDVLRQVLDSGKPMEIRAAEADKLMPTAFIREFGKTDYDIIPLKSVNRTIGLMVVDNTFHRGPEKNDLVPHLDALTNQAAVIYENLQQRADQKKLIDLTYATFDLGQRTLKQKLDQICEIARSFTHADRVLIYPLQSNSASLEFDAGNVGRAGEDPGFAEAQIPRPGGLTVHLLQSGESIIAVPDVTQCDLAYRDERLANHPYLKNEGICALIGVSICDPDSGDKRGVLYLDYRRPQNFTEYDKRQARELAGLAAMFIGQAHAREREQGLQMARKAREVELSLLGQVLENALEAAQDEEQGKSEEKIVQLLLDAVPTLFESVPVTAGITLKRWEHRGLDQEPVEMHDYLYAQDSYIQNRTLQREEDKGINNRAMASNTIQNVSDVLKDPDYRPRRKGTNTRSELDVPIELDGQVIGAFNIESPRLTAFTKHHEKMAQRFGHVAALALGNIRRQRNLRTVLSAASAVTGPADLTETLEKIADEIRKAVPNLSTLVIWYLDPESAMLRLGSYFGVRDVPHLLTDLPRGRGAVQTGLELAEPLWETDVPENELFRSGTFVEIERIQSTAVFPLRAQDKIIGVMFFSYRERHNFTDEERRLYPILAEVVASSINDALQLHQIQQEQKRLTALQQISEVVSKGITEEQILTEMNVILENLYPDTTLWYVPYDERKAELIFSLGAVRHSLSDNVAPDCFPCYLADSFLRTRRKLVRVCRYDREQTTLTLNSKSISALAATLVRNADRKGVEPGLLGILMLESPNPDAFGEADEKMMENIARQVRIGLERLEQEKNARFQSTVIGHTSWATPVIHDINRYTGRILHRVRRLQREDGLTIDGHTVVQEIHRQTQEMRERVTAVDLRQEEEIAIEIDTVLPKWIRSTLSERSVPIALELDLNASGVRVVALSKALRQVVYDLVRNGMEAMGFEQPNQQMAVSTRLSSNDRYLDITIWNNGPPIPLSVQPKLFNDLYSSKGEERGIGLLFARSAVERMQGQVWLASSSAEDGTRFNVRLRVADIPNR